MLFGLDALGQADWGVIRDPFDKALIGRLKANLRKKPWDKSSFKKLFGLYRRHRTTQELVKEYKSKKDLASRTVLCRVYVSKRENEKSSQCFESLVETDPQNKQAWIQLAEVFQEMNDELKLFEALLRVYELSSEESKKKLSKQLLRSGMRLGRDESVHTWTAKSSERQRFSASDWLELGNYWLNKQDYAAASDSFNRGLSQKHLGKTERSMFYERLGQVYLGQDDFLNAVKSQKSAIDNIGRKHDSYFWHLEKLSDLYRKKDRLDELLVELDTAWTITRRNKSEMEFLADLNQERGNLLKAEELYRKALKSAPKERRVHEKIIRVLNVLGEQEEAIVATETLIGLFPNEPNHQIELAGRFYAMGKEKLAKERLLNIERRHRKNSWVLSTLVDTYSAWGLNKDALRCTNKLIKLDPSSSRNIVLLGEQFDAAGNTKQAEETWKRILKKRNAESFAEYAKILSEHDRLPEAIKAITQAINKKTAQLEWIRLRAQVYERLKMTSLAISDWRRILEFIPSANPNDMLRDEAENRIVYLLANGNSRIFKKQVEEWKDSFDKDHENLSSGRMLFLAASLMGDNPLIESTLNLLLKASSKRQKWLMSLVDHYDNVQEYGKAISILENEVAQQHPASKAVLKRLFGLRSLMHQDDKALEILQEMLRSNPKDADAHLNMASLMNSMGNTKEAINFYEKAQRLRPSDYEASSRLAEIYTRENDGERALRAYGHLVGISKRGNGLELIVSKVLALNPDISEMMWFEQKLYKKYEVNRRDAQTKGALLFLYEHLLVDKQRRRNHENVFVEDVAKKSLAPSLDALREGSPISQQKRALRLLVHTHATESASHLVRYAKSLSKTKKNDVVSKSLRQELKNKTLMALAQIGGEEAVEYLLETLEAKQPEALQASLLFVGLHRSNKLLSVLVQSIDDIKRTGLLPFFIWSLGQSTDPNILALLEAYTHETSLDLQEQSIALLALSKNSSLRSDAVLESVFDERPDLKQVAARGLFSKYARRLEGEKAAYYYWLLSEMDPIVFDVVQKTENQTILWRKNIVNCFVLHHSNGGGCLFKHVSNGLVADGIKRFGALEKSGGMLVSALEKHISEKDKHAFLILNQLANQKNLLNLERLESHVNISPERAKQCEGLLLPYAKSQMKNKKQNIRLVALDVFAKLATGADADEMDGAFLETNQLDVLARKDAMHRLRTRKLGGDLERNKGGLPFYKRYSRAKSELEKWNLLKMIEKDGNVTSKDIKFLVSMSSPERERNDVLRRQILVCLKRFVREDEVKKVFGRARSDPSFLVRFKAMSI